MTVPKDAGSVNAKMTYATEEWSDWQEAALQQDGKVSCEWCGQPWPMDDTMVWHDSQFCTGDCVEQARAREQKWHLHQTHVQRVPGCVYCTVHWFAGGGR